MKRNSSPFKWRHYAPDVIVLCVRWYCRYQLSYRELEETMRELGLAVDLVTIFRWVQRYAPEINKRMRLHLKMSGTSYRLDETARDHGHARQQFALLRQDRPRKDAPASRLSHA
jgi:transposase-like protein